MRLRWVSVLLLLAAPAAAQPPGPNATWYTIVAENGDTVGYASREILEGREGREVIDASEIRLQQNLDPTRRIVERIVTRLDGDGRAGLDRLLDADWPDLVAGRGADRPRNRRDRPPGFGRAAAAAAGAAARRSASTAARGCSPPGIRRRRRGSTS